MYIIWGISLTSLNSSYLFIYLQCKTTHFKLLLLYSGPNSFQWLIGKWEELKDGSNKIHYGNCRPSSSYFQVECEFDFETWTLINSFSEDGKNVSNDCNCGIEGHYTDDDILIWNKETRNGIIENYAVWKRPGKTLYTL